MLVGQIIDLFHDIDLSEIRTDIENAHSSWYDETFDLSQNIKGNEIDVKFKVQGRNLGYYFSLSYFTLIDLKFYLKGETEPHKISDGSLIRIEKILKRKVIEL